MTTRTRILGCLAAVVVALSGSLVLAAPASADIGDGSQACNMYEICFKRDAGGPNLYLRHFYNNDLNHGLLVFSDNGGPLMDNITSYYNRDSECNVWLEDIIGNVWTAYYIMERRQSGGYYALPSDKNDRNNGHWRCSNY